MDSFFLAETLKYLFLLFDEGISASNNESVFCQTKDDVNLEEIEGLGVLNTNYEGMLTLFLMPLAGLLFCVELHFVAPSCNLF
jgi:hypothetical protein